MSVPAKSQTNPVFMAWMEELHRVHIEVFKVKEWSHAALSTKPGSAEEDDWYEFFLDGYSPTEAIAQDILEG